MPAGAMLMAQRHELQGPPGCLPMHHQRGTARWQQLPLRAPHFASDSPVQCCQQHCPERGGCGRQELLRGDGALLVMQGVESAWSYAHRRTSWAAARGAVVLMRCCRACCGRATRKGAMAAPVRDCATRCRECMLYHEQCPRGTWQRQARQATSRRKGEAWTVHTSGPVVPSCRLNDEGTGYALQYSKSSHLGKLVLSHICGCFNRLPMADHEMLSQWGASDWTPVTGARYKADW